MKSADPGREPEHQLVLESETGSQLVMKSADSDSEISPEFNPENDHAGNSGITLATWESHRKLGNHADIGGIRDISGNQGTANFGDHNELATDMEIGSSVGPDIETDSGSYNNLHLKHLRFIDVYVDHAGTLATPVLVSCLCEFSNCMTIFWCVNFIYIS
jgi:hypothetical protein